MLSKKLQLNLNEQIIAGLWSANFYLSLSFYFRKEGFDGFAYWMRKQSEEKLRHARIMADYVIKRGGYSPAIGRIDEVPDYWASPLVACTHAHEHECHVSGMMNNLIRVAAEQKEYVTQDFLYGLLREQVEKETEVQSIVDKVQKAGYAGLLFIDTQMGKCDM